jgi:N utilization substance protein B
MPATRRKARIAAFQTLYEIEVTQHDPESTLERLLIEGKVASDSQAFARELVHGVLENQPAIDQEIVLAAPTWPLDQMSPVDKNILRLALFEVLFHNRAPLKAAINEAVELAKSFGSDSSARFVNGVLGSIAGRPRAQLP